MGVREQLNRNRKWAQCLAGGIIVLAAVLLVWKLRAGESSYTGKAFFSADDGKTWFADDIHKLPPFDRDGRSAYRAYVYTCDGGKTRWVGYLQRYTSEAKAQAEQARRANARSAGPVTTGIELKRPGDSNWIAQADMERSREVLDVRCPHGPEHTVELVDP